MRCGAKFRLFGQRHSNNCLSCPIFLLHFKEKLLVVLMDPVDFQRADQVFILIYRFRSALLGSLLWILLSLVMAYHWGGTTLSEALEKWLLAEDQICWVKVLDQNISVVLSRVRISLYDLIGPLYMAVITEPGGGSSFEQTGNLLVFLLGILGALGKNGWDCRAQNGHFREILLLSVEYLCLTPIDANLYLRI